MYQQFSSNTIHYTTNKMISYQCLLFFHPFTLYSSLFPSLSHFTRTTRGWRERWRRSSERGKSWRESSGGFWRTWMTQPGMRLTSEIIMDETTFWILDDQITYELSMWTEAANSSSPFPLALIFTVTNKMWQTLDQEKIPARHQQTHPNRP